MKILFVCTANLNRSKTAENLFKDKYDVKSAGTLSRDTDFTTAVKKELIDWADIIIVFEKEHVLELQELFAGLEKTIVNLQVPDMYPYNDPELIEILQKRIPHVLKKTASLHEKPYDYSQL